MTDEAKAAVSRILRESGLALHGFCPFSAVEGRLLPCRGRERLVQAFPPAAPARTVIAALFPYRFPDEGPCPGGEPPAVSAAPEGAGPSPDAGARSNLSRYARVPDYHQAAGAVLERAAAALAAAFPEGRFLPFIDNSPIPEVRAAALAGLGVVGENGLLIHPDYGSWVFIGAIVTGLALAGPVPAEPPRCPRCGRCAAACPAGCLPRPGGNPPVAPADGRGGTCLSAVTQKKGELTLQEAQLIRDSGMAWGCDLCQEACPLNRTARIAPHPCFAGRYEPCLTPESLKDLAGKAYGWRGKKVPARNLSLIDAKVR